MKHRERNKLTMSNVKQEDQKHAAFTHAQSSIDVNTNTTATLGLTIKQEESKDHKVSSKQHGIYGEKDYYYRCDICKQRSPDIKSVLEHRKSIHVVKRFSNTKIKNLDEEPDVHDPDYYCKSCERSYSDTNAYRHHLRAVHHMILKPLPRWKTTRNGIAPDPNDPNLYCRACDVTYKRERIYKQHCRYVHGLSPTKFANGTPLSSSLTDSYCQACDKRLSSVGAYRRHLFIAHKVDGRPIQQKRNDITPDVNDPNFHCRSCEKKLTSKYSFTQHLMTVHSIFKSAPKKKSGLLKPSVDDPNNYCLACKKSYISKGGYRTHLRVVHHITLHPLKSSINREQLPDPHNPDYYCSVCKKGYASLALYRQHCKVTHFMALKHASIHNPSAEINVSDPERYCAQCEHSFAAMSCFKRHLRRVHHIV